MSRKNKPQPEEILSMGEGHYRLLFENNPLPMWTFDMKSLRFLAVNEAAIEKYGYSREEFLGMTILDIRPSQDTEPLKKFHAGEHPSRMVEKGWQHRLQDGTLIDVEISSHEIDLAGRAVRLVVAQDVTERKQAEKDLEESEQRFSTAFFTNPVSQSILSATSGLIEEVNDACCNLFGYGRAELIGFDPGQLNLWANPDDQILVLEELQKTGHVLPTEIAIRRKSGEICTVLFAVEPITWKGTPCLITTSLDITGRKQAEEKLRDSEEKFRSVVECTPDIIFTVNRQNLIQFINRVPAGMTADQAIGTSALDYVQPEYRVTVEKAIRQVFETGQETSYEIQARGANDVVAWYSTRLAGMNLGSENEQVLLITQDITARKQAEKSLVESEERLQHIMEGSQLGYWDWNIETGEVHRNARWAEMLGYTLEEIQFNVKQWTDLHHPDDRETAWKFIQEHLDGKTDAHRAEYRMRTRDGSYKWILDQAKVVTRDAQGKPLRMCGTHTDITERKQAEEAMRASESNYRKLIETSESAFAVIDRDGKILYSNPFGIQIWQDLDIVGKTIFDVYPREYAGRYLETIQTVIDTRANIKDEIASPISGKRMWFAYSLTPLTNPDGTVTTALLNAWDLTARKQAEEKLRESEAHARAMLDAIPDMMFRLDRSGTFLDYKADVRDLHEQTIPLIGQRNRDISPPEFADLIERKIAETLDTGQLQTFEYQLPVPDAGPLDFEARMAPAGQDEVIAIVRNITERKRAEEQIRQSEERFRILFETMTQGVVYQDAQGQIVSANPAAERILGLSLDQMQGRTSIDPAWHSIHEDGSDFPGETHPAMTALATGRPIMNTVMGVFHPALNRNRWINVNAMPQFRPGESRPYQVYATFEDITERKQAEDDALYRQNLLEKVIHLGKNITAITDLDTCLRQIHHSARQGLGFDRVGLFLYDETTNSVRGTYGTGSNGEMEDTGWFHRSLDEWTDWKAALESPSGMSIARDFQATYHPLPDDEMYGVEEHVILAAWVGERPVALLAVDNLASHRRMAPADLEALQLFAGYAGLAISNALLHGGLEQRIQERTAEAEAIRQRLELATRAASLGIWDWNAQTNQLLWDEQMFAIHGKEKDSFTDNLEYFMSTLHPEDINQVMQTTQKLFDGSLSHGQIEYRVIRGDGSIGYIKTYGIVRHNLQNQVEHVIGMAQDVTQEKLAEQALRDRETQLRQNRDELSAANLALEKALHTKDEFLANMSHELRTPLTGILGMSEILAEGIRGPLNERQLQLIDTIHSSGSHLLSLINDILDLSKIEADKFDLNIERVSIAEVCEASLAFIKEPATQKGISISYEHTPGVNFLQADLRRLKQILVNLLSNAVKFTPSNGQVSLQVWSDIEKNRVNFTVKDTGIGISAEDLRRLFTPFTQVDTSLTRRYEGTGLGLALVKRLTEMHGGSISVTSEPGEGSCFTVSIPWQPNFPEEALSSSEMASPAVHPMENIGIAAPRTILLAEDNENNIMTIGDYLEAKGHRLVYARNGWEALKKAAECSPDLILMDIQMPEMDGLEATRRLRADHRFAATPIVALTALAMEGDRERCLDAGASNYLSKPVRLKDLTDLIHEILESGAA